jgi:hypothetical protein
MKIPINSKSHYQKLRKKNAKLSLLNQLNRLKSLQLLMRIISKVKQNLSKMQLKNYYVQDVFFVVHMFMDII